MAKRKPPAPGRGPSRSPAPPAGSSDRPAAQTGSAYVRHLLATGTPPEARVKGWVAAMITGGVDKVPKAELVTRYGAALRAECRQAGFEPHCDRPLRAQSTAAQQAARQWAQRLLHEHSY